MSDSTDEKQDNPHLFQPGQSGNPAGRPKGSRNKLGEAFLADLYKNWHEHGSVTIETVRNERPHEYLKVVASVLPKELNLKVSELDELTDEQLARQFAAVASQLAAAGFDLGSRIGAQETPEPSGDVPTIQ